MVDTMYFVSIMVYFVFWIVCLVFDIIYLDDGMDGCHRKAWFVVPEKKEIQIEGITQLSDHQVKAFIN